VTAVAVASLLAVAAWLLGRSRPVSPPAARQHGGRWSRGRSSAPGGRRRLRRSAALLARRERRTVDRVELEALDLLDGLAPALRAGLPPVAALRLVASSSADGPLLGLGRAAALGEPLAPVWSAFAESTRSDDLRLVAAAWSMCDTLGSPLATTVAAVSDVVRRRRVVQQRTAAALAGPRATMRVLTALPLSGPVVALAVGVSPGDLYTPPAGLFSLVVGLVVLAFGRLWAARMIRAVSVERRRRP
jgi:tight adherence protein B